jgi:hypothetical protein
MMPALATRIGTEAEANAAEAAAADQPLTAVGAFPQGNPNLTSLLPLEEMPDSFAQGAVPKSPDWRPMWPQNNAAQPTTAPANTVKVTGSAPAAVILPPSAVGGNLTWRGSWNPSNLYPINSVVLFNISLYLATAANSGAKPDAGGPWTLLGKNLNFRSQQAIAPTYVQGAQVTTSASPNPFTLAFPSNNAAGNFILAFAFLDSPSGGVAVTISDSQGNTYVQVGTIQQAIFGGVAQIAVFVAANIAGGANTVSAAYTGTATNGILTIAEYAGVATASPVASNAWARTSGSPAAVSLTTTAPNQTILLIGTANPTGGSAPALPSGFTLRNNDAVNHSMLADGTIASASTANYNFTVTGAAENFTWGLVLTSGSGFPGGFKPFDTAEFSGSVWVCVAETTEDPSADPDAWFLIGPGGGANLVQAEVDFGFDTGLEGDLARVTLTGLPWVTADSIILCAPAGLATADHDPEDAAIEGIIACAENLAPGVGFDIVAKACGDSGATWGKYLINATGA